MSDSSLVPGDGSVNPASEVAAAAAVEEAEPARSRPRGSSNRERAAEDLLKRDFVPLPLPPRRKGPKDAGWHKWTHLEVSRRFMAGGFSGAGGLGLRLSERLVDRVMHQLVDIDFDVMKSTALDARARRALSKKIERVLAATLAAPCSFGRPIATCAPVITHTLLLIPADDGRGARGLPKEIAFAPSDAARTKIEVRSVPEGGGKAMQTVIPPTRSADPEWQGEQLGWIDGAFGPDRMPDVPMVSADTARALLRELAACCEEALAVKASWKPRVDAAVLRGAPRVGGAVGQPSDNIFHRPLAALRLLGREHGSRIDARCPFALQPVSPGYRERMFSGGRGAVTVPIEVIRDMDRSLRASLIGVAQHELDSILEYRHSGAAARSNSRVGSETVLGAPDAWGDGQHDAVGFLPGPVICLHTGCPGHPGAHPAGSHAFSRAFRKARIIADAYLTRLSTAQLDTVIDWLEVHGDDKLGRPPVRMAVTARCWFKAIRLDYDPRNRHELLLFIIDNALDSLPRGLVPGTVARVRDEATIRPTTKRANPRARADAEFGFAPGTAARLCGEAEDALDARLRARTEAWMAVRQQRRERAALEAARALKSDCDVPPASRDVAVSRAAAPGSEPGYEAVAETDVTCGIDHVVDPEAEDVTAHLRELVAAQGDGSAPGVVSYVARDGMTFMVKPPPATRRNREGTTAGARPTVVLLANYSALILYQTRYHGISRPEEVLIQAMRPDGTSTLLEVPSAEVHSGAWMKKLPANYALAAGSGLADHARAAVQRLSDRRHGGRIPVKHRYGTTGWHRVARPETVGEEPGTSWRFLLPNGSVGADGFCTEPRTWLQPGAETWSEYQLRPPLAGDELRDAGRSLLGMLEAGPRGPMLALLGTIFGSVYGSSNFVLTLDGESGAHKTTLALLALSAFAPRYAERDCPVPLSFDATIGAAEALLAIGADVPKILDDLNTGAGDAVNARAVAVASATTRRQASGASRKRLNRQSGLMKSPSPAGTLILTREQQISGQSDSARELNLVLTPEGHRYDRALSACQAAGVAGVFAGLMATYLQRMAARGDITKQKRSFREAAERAAESFSADHPRVGRSLGWVTAGLQRLLEFLEEIGAVNSADHAALRQEWEVAVSTIVAKRRDTAAEADFTEEMLESLREGLATGRFQLGCAGGPREVNVGESTTRPELVALFPRACLEAAGLLRPSGKKLSAQDMGRRLLSRGYLRNLDDGTARPLDDARRADVAYKTKAGTSTRVWIVELALVGRVGGDGSMEEI